MNRYAGVLAVLLLLVVPALMILPSARAEINEPHDSGTGLDPVASDGEYHTNGTWTIEAGETKTYTGKTIVVEGSLYVAGNLTLSGCTIILNSTQTYPNHRFQLNGTGSLNLTDCIINCTPASVYLYYQIGTSSWCNLVIENTTFKNAKGNSHLMYISPLCETEDVWIHNSWLLNVRWLTPGGGSRSYYINDSVVGYASPSTMSDDVYIQCDSAADNYHVYLRNCDYKRVGVAGTAGSSSEVVAQNKLTCTARNDAGTLLTSTSITFEHGGTSWTTSTDGSGQATYWVNSTVGTYPAAGRTWVNNSLVNVTCNSKTFRTEVYRPKSVTVGTLNQTWVPRIARAPYMYDFGVAVIDHPDGTDYRNGNKTWSMLTGLGIGGWRGNWCNWSAGGGYSGGYQGFEHNETERAFIRWLGNQSLADVGIHSLDSSGAMMTGADLGYAWDMWDLHFAQTTNAQDKIYVEHSEANPIKLVNEGLNASSTYYSLPHIQDNSKWVWLAFFNTSYPQYSGFSGEFQYSTVNYDGWCSYRAAVPAAPDAWTYNGGNVTDTTTLFPSNSWDLDLFKTTDAGSGRDITSCVQANVGCLDEFHDIYLDYIHGTTVDLSPYSDPTGDVVRSDIRWKYNQIASRDFWSDCLDDMLTYLKALEDVTLTASSSSSFTVKNGGSSTITGAQVYIDTLGLDIYVSSATIGGERILSLDGNMICIPTIGAGQSLTVSYSIASSAPSAVLTVSQTHYAARYATTDLYYSQPSTASVTIGIPSGWSSYRISVYDTTSGQSVTVTKGSSSFTFTATAGHVYRVRDSTVYMSSVVIPEVINSMAAMFPVLATVMMIGIFAGALGAVFGAFRGFRSR